MMKTLAIIITSILLSTFGAQKAQTITVTIHNISSDEGKVGYALYNKEGFLQNPIQRSFSKIEEGTSTFTFKNVESEEYAVVCFYDRNNNNKLDFTAQGMPMEDYGASNNILRFGPPSYDNAKFTISDKDVSLEIKF